MVAEAQKCGMVRTSVGGDGINMERGGGEGAGGKGRTFWEYRSAKINGFWERGRHVWFLGCEEGFFGVFVDCGVACCAGDEVELLRMGCYFRHQGYSIWMKSRRQ